jgi:hypothetical protein
VGNFQGSDVGAVHTVEVFYQKANIDALLTNAAIDDAIAQLRTETNSHQHSDGTQEPDFPDNAWVRFGDPIVNRP